MSYLSDFEELNGGYVAFRGNPKGDDYSRFIWVFFLATKDETSPILKTFLTGLENQLSLKVKVIRGDNETEFKNNDLNQFCGMKGIKREFSVSITPQQNGITERKNRTLIEAARTMLNTEEDVAFDAKKPKSEVIVSPSSNLSVEFKDFSDESINKVNAASTLVPAVGKISHNNTNTFSAAGPSNAAASPTHRKSSCIDVYQLPDDPDMPELEDIAYSDDEDDVGAEADFNNLETYITIGPIPTTRVHKDHPVTQIIGDLSLAIQTRSMTRVAKDQGGISQMFNDDFYTYTKSASTLIDTEKPLLKDPDGVNTPRSDEDRLELMELTVFLLPSDKKVGVKVNAVDLQASAVRLILLLLVQKLLLFGLTNGVACLVMLEGVECLPNEEIFAALARMGYEKPSTKLTFYKAFFSSQWKFLIHNILKQVGDLSTHTIKYTSPALTQKVFANLRRVEDVNAGDAAEGDVSAANQEVQSQSPQPQPPPTHDVGIPMNLLQEIMDTCTALTRRVEHLELDKIAQALEITKLRQRVKKLERRNKVKVLKLRRMIAKIDVDADVVLEEAKEVIDDAKADQDAKVDESTDIQGRQSKSQAEIYKIDLEHANKVLRMPEDESEPAEV
nr:putative ribonuclease H-like domain-containing protein [Tanacetum cinerariifolium]